MGTLTDVIRRTGRLNAVPREEGAGFGQVSEREQAIIDRYKSSFGSGQLSQTIATGRAQKEIDARRQQRAYSEQAPPEMAEPVREMLSNLGNRAKVLDTYRKLSPEQRQEALRLAPGISQQLGDDRGGAVGRTLGAVSRGISHGVSQPIAELVGLGGTPEEIEFIRQLDAAASQEFSPARPGDPWYERGPLQAAEMAPWMATVVTGAGLGRAAATGIAGRVAGRAAAGGKIAGAITKATPAIGKAGELAGITAAAFPSQYAQEVDQLKALGMEDNLTMRLLAGGTAAITGLVEGIVPNPFGAGKVPLTEGAVKAARQYLWEAAKKAPGEMSEEYLQGVTSGLGAHVAQYLDENAEEKTIADAFQNGWEQAKEAALPMAFLLGVPGLGGAGLSAVRAQRLSRLQEIRAKGFVSAEEAKELGIQGKNRGERKANTDAEIEQLSAIPPEVSQTVVPTPPPLPQGVPNASQVPTNEGSPQVQGDGGQGSQVDSGSQVRVPGQDQGSAQPASQEPATPEVQVAATPWVKQQGSDGGAKAIYESDGFKIYEGADGVFTASETRPNGREYGFMPEWDSLEQAQAYVDGQRSKSKLTQTEVDSRNAEVTKKKDISNLEYALGDNPDVNAIETVKRYGIDPSDKDAIAKQIEQLKTQSPPVSGSSEGKSGSTTVRPDAPVAPETSMGKAEGENQSSEARADTPVKDWDVGRRAAARSPLREILLTPTFQKIKGRDPTWEELGPEIDKAEAKSQSSRVNDGINWKDVKAYAQSQFGQKEESAPKVSAENQPRRGEVGGKLAAGEVVTTSSGRQTTPFPEIVMGSDRKAGNTLKRVDKWLYDNAVEEARARGDNFNLRQFEGEDPAKMPPASKDAMEEYLFGEQPAVVPPITKPLVTPKTESKWQSETRTKLEAVPALKGAKVEADEKAGTVKVTRPDGLSTTIHFNADEELAKAAKSKLRNPGSIYGRYVREPGAKEGKIYIRSDADHTNILNHEVMHWLEDQGVVTPEEVEKYGGREEIATKYGKWAALKQRKKDSVFQRIYDALEPVFSSQRRFFEEVGTRKKSSENVENVTARSDKSSELDSKPGTQPEGVGSSAPEIRGADLPASEQARANLRKRGKKKPSQAELDAEAAAVIREREADNKVRQEFKADRDAQKAQDARREFVSAQKTLANPATVDSLGVGDISQVNDDIERGRVSYDDATKVADEFVAAGYLPQGKRDQIRKPEPTGEQDTGTKRGQTGEQLGNKPSKKPEVSTIVDKTADTAPVPQQPEGGGPATTEGQVPPTQAESLPWINSTAEQESSWYGTKVNVAPANRREDAYTGQVVRVLNRGEMVEVQPDGQDGTFRVDSSRITLAEEQAPTTEKQPEEQASKPLPEPETPKFTRTTPDKGSTTRTFQSERVDKARADIAELEKKARAKRSEHDSLRSNATKKRAAVRKEIESFNRMIQKTQGEIASDMAADTLAKLEDELESPRSYDHYLAGMKAIHKLKASVAEDAARRGEMGRQAAITVVEKEQKEADRLDAELQSRAKEIAMSKGFTSGDADQIALSASNGFTVFEDRSLADIVEVQGKRTRESRVSQEINKLKPEQYGRRDLSDEQITEFTKQYQEASQDDKNWLAKRLVVDTAVKDAINASREAVRKREDEERKVKEAEKSKEEQEALANARERAKKYFLDERISKALKKQKPKTKAVMVRVEEGGKRKLVEGKTTDGDQKGELYPNGLILHKSFDEDSKDFVLTHARSGLGFPFSAKKSDMQELIGVIDILGVDFNVDTDEKGALPAELQSRMKKINTAWDNGDYAMLSEQDYATVQSLAETAKTDIDADLILTSDDLGANGIPPGLDKVMTDKGLRIIKEMAIAVPEFAYDPVFTVKDGKLLYRDGFEFKLEPTAFNLHSSELKEGQTVGINLEDLGIKRATPQDVVAQVMKGTGIPRVTKGKGGDVSVGYVGSIQTSLQQGENDNEWDVVGGSPKVREVAIAALKKIRWRQPGQDGDPKTDIDISPAWLRAGAPIGTAVYHKGTEYEVAGHRKDTDILYADGDKFVALPAKELTDKEGTPIFPDLQEPEASDGEGGGIAQMQAIPTRQSRSKRFKGDAASAAIAAADIQKTAERLFDVPIRQGGFNQRAAGIYKWITRRTGPPSPEVVRTAEDHYANLAVVAHEIAHHIDETVKAVRSMPKAVKQEIKRLDYEPEKERAFEGWAEFLRRYMTEPPIDVAGTMVPNPGLDAPKTLAWFESTFLQAHPEVAKSIAEFRKYAQQFAQQSVFQRVGTLIADRQPQDLSFKERWLSKARRRVHRLKTNFIDKFHTLEWIQKEAENRGHEGIGIYDLTMAHYMSATSHATIAFEEGVRTLQTGAPIGSTTLWGLRDNLEADGEYNDAVLYSLARHTLFMNDTKPGYNTGMDVKDAEAWITEVEASGKRDRFEKFAKQLAQFNDDLIEMLVEAGALPKKDADTMLRSYDNQNYFPLHRVQDTDRSMFAGSGAGFVNLGRAVPGRSRKGSGRQIVDPVDATVTRAIRFYGRAIQARQQQVLAEALDPLMGGVGGMGGLMDRVDPRRTVTQGTIEEILKTLTEEGVIEADDANAMRIAAKILNPEGGTPGAEAIEWFAERHGIEEVDGEYDMDALEQAASDEPDALAVISLWRPDYTPSAQKRTVVIYDKQGKPIMYEMDPDLYATATGMDELQFGPFMSVFREAARWFKTGAVSASTGFGTANLLRDYWEFQGKARHTKGLASLGKPPAMLGRYIAEKSRKLAGFKANDPLIRLYEESGGKVYSVIGHDVRSRKQYRRRRIGKSTMSKLGLSMARPGDTAESLLDGIQDLIAISDAPPRLADAEAAIKEDGFVVRDGKWFDTNASEFVDHLPEATRIKAATAMAEATINFKRIGAKGQYIEAFMPFFNATVQSMYRQYGQIKGLKRIGRKDVDGLRAQRYLVYMSALASMGVLYWMLRRDDDDWREQDAYLRDGYWTWGANGKTYVRIPKPRDTAIVSNIVENMLDAWYRDDAREMKDVVLRDFGGRLPTGGGLVRGALETYIADYDYFRERDLTPEYMKELPKEQQFTSHTTRASKAIGQVTGRYLQTSPIQLEHLLSSASGGFYRRMADLYDASLDGRLGPEHLPFLRGLVLDRHQARSVNDFYDTWEQSELSAKREEASNGKVSDATTGKLAVLAGHAELMTAIRNLEQTVGTRRDYAYQPYIVGLARHSLGYEELPSNPNPLTAEDVPPPIADLMKDYTGRVVMQASETLKALKEYEDEEAYQTQYNTVLRGKVKLTSLGLTLEQAKKSLLDYWAVRYGSVRETKGGRPVLKESVRKRLNELTKLYTTE